MRRAACTTFFFFPAARTAEVYTLSLHDALPICCRSARPRGASCPRCCRRRGQDRSEEHTSELQSPDQLVCRLLLEKKNRTSSKSLTMISRPICTGDSSWPRR